MNFFRTAVVCAAVTAAGSFVGAGPASAQPSNPCEDDANNLCSGMEPGSDEMGQCMQSHMDDLSDGCKQFMQSKGGGPGGGGPGGGPGGGGPEGGPGEGGPDEGGPEGGPGGGPGGGRGGRRGGDGMQVCRDDAERLCSGMDPGSDEMGQCMQSHMDDLSDACKTAMSKGPGGGMTACRDDAQKLCEGMQPGSDEMGQCMQSHTGELSEACKKAMEKGGPGGRGPGGGMSACRDDAEKLCEGMQPGSDEMGQCMQSHMGDLSEACKKAMEQGGPGGNMSACRKDAEKLCSGMSPGSDQMKECMQSHQEELSDACKEAMKKGGGGRGPGAGGRGKRGRSGGQGGGGMTACRDDAKKLCPGMKRGPEMKECMQSHMDEVSDKCREAMQRQQGRGGAGKTGARASGAAAKGRRGGKSAAVMQACDSEIKSFCAGNASSPGASISCLKLHADKASERCWNQLKALPDGGASEGDSSGDSQGDAPPPSGD